MVHIETDPPESTMDKDGYGAYHNAVMGRVLDNVRGVTSPDNNTCEALARKGTGEGMCDRPLDSHGRCDRASDHIWPTEY